jgi:hypothetical protein
LREDDANGNEDGASARSKRDGDFDIGAFGELITAAEADAALEMIFNTSSAKLTDARVE